MKYLLLAMSVVLMLAPWPVRAQDEDATEGADAEAQSEEESEEQRQVRRLGDVVGSSEEEFSMEIPELDVPQQPAEAVPEVTLPDPQRDERLQMLLRQRAFSPNNPDTDAALSALLDEVGADIRQALADGDIQLARQLAAVVAEIDPEREVVGEVSAAIERQNTIGETLAAAEQALEAGRLVTPEDESAAALFNRVLELDPDNEAAQQGLVRVHEALLADAIALAQELDFEGAEERIVEAEAVREAPEAVADTRASIADYRMRRIEELDRTVVEHIDAGRYDQAEDTLTELVALGHQQQRLQALRNSLADARLYGSFEPGQQFSDNLDRLGISGPEMVVVPAGSFMMGSPDNEQDRMSNEGPQHRVTFDRGFAISRTEVTVDQFRTFVSDTGYRTDAEIEGESRVYDLESGRMDEADDIDWSDDYAGEPAADSLPVIHVSWRDAEAFVNWLSEQTGRNYRLPTEAEFEYALRGGTQTPYWWGEGSPPDDDIENVTGDSDVSPTGARWNVAFPRYGDGFWGPAPVGSLQPNPFGLYDMGGNVMEWVADCWHESYVRAPDDGSAWINPGCERRVIRGGSWSSTPAMSRSAFRISSAFSSTDMRVGFRVARDL
jgi:formylglycine-generating enzyme required for sulfatase activity